MPTNIIVHEKNPPNSSIDYTLLLNGVKNGTKVIYWDEKSNNNNINPIEIYNNYTNSGVSIVMNNKANITLFCQYKINNNSIKKKIFYRLQCPETGIISSILIIYINC